MLRRNVAIIAAAFAVVLLIATPASAQQEWALFGDADWRPRVGNESQHGLVTRSADGTFGGIELADPPSDPGDITALSFDFNPNKSGGSGGSPRLVVVFNDGGNAGLRPLSWTAGTWETLDGMTGTNWDNNSGGCGFRFAISWTDVVACHPGATITDIFVVNDSGWLYPPDGEQVVLDNITVSDTVATGPGNSS